MLKNFAKDMFVVLVALFVGVTSVNAQDGNIEITEKEAAIALSVLTNGNCFNVVPSSDGVLTCELHGGFYGLVAGNANIHDFSNNDGVADIGAKTTFGGDLGIGYRMVKKGWRLAGFGEVFGGVNSGYHVENRQLDGHFHFGALVGVENSHGVVNVGVGIKYLYDNAVSENANRTPWRGNKHKFEPFARVTTKLFSIKQNKTARVGNKQIPVRGLREVKLFGEVSYNLTNTIDKYWDDADALNKNFSPELKDKCWTIRVGLTFNIR